MEVLFIFLGFVALLMALNARKRAMVLALELDAQKARPQSLEGDVERLLRRSPDAAPTDAVAPETVAPATAVEPPEVQPARPTAPEPAPELERPSVPPMPPAPAAAG